VKISKKKIKTPFIVSSPKLLYCQKKIQFSALGVNAAKINCKKLLKLHSKMNSISSFFQKMLRLLEKQDSP